MGSAAVGTVERVDVEVSEARPGGQVPQLDRRLDGRQHARAVGRDLRRADSPAQINRELDRRILDRELPDAVGRSHDDPPIVGRHVEIERRAAEPDIVRQLPASPDVPDPDRLVVSGGDEARPAQAGHIRPQQ